MNKSLRWSTSVFFLGYLLLTFYIVQAQDGERVIVQLKNNQVMIYTLRSTGEITPLTEAMQSVNSELEAIFPATVRSPFDVIVSSDGRYVALLASTTTSPTIATLIVYSMATNTILAEKIGGYGSIQWSPLSDAIILYPSVEVGEYTRLNDIYIYDLASTTLDQVTNNGTDIIERNLIWIPNSKRIVFSGSLVDCSTVVCEASENIFIIDADGTDLAQLTQLDLLLPLEPEPYGYCTISTAFWSLIREKILYIVSCDDANRELLYAVDLASQNVMELSLSTLFQSTETLTYSERHIPGLHVDPMDASVIAIVSEAHQEIEQYTIEMTLHFIKILDGEASTIFSLDIAPTETVSTSSFNVEKKVIAVGTFVLGSQKTGSIHILNLDTLQLASITTPNRVCNVSWLNDTLLVYDQLFEGFCGGPTNSAWMLNTDTGVTTQIPLMDR